MKTFKTTAWPVVTYVAEIPEEEALSKICCGPTGCGVIREQNQVHGRFCLGSMCMAWRWGADLIERGRNMHLTGLSHPQRDMVVEFADERYDVPVPVEVFRPAGNGWVLNYLPSDLNIAFWSRPAGKRGYCAWAGRTPGDGK